MDSICLHCGLPITLNSKDAYFNPGQWVHCKTNCIACQCQSWLARDYPENYQCDLAAGHTGSHQHKRLEWG